MAQVHLQTRPRRGEPLSLRLARPSRELRAGYLEMLRAYERAGLAPHGPRATLVRRDFETYLAWVNRGCRPVGADPGRMRMSMYWLIDSGRRVLGSGRVRHWLTEQSFRVGGHIGYDVRPDMRARGLGLAQLELLLREARRLGIVRALLTVDEDNTASRRIIERCGGVLGRSVRHRGRRHLRYWIWL